MKTFKVGDLDVTCLSDGILKSSLDFAIGMERDQAIRLAGGAEDGSVFIPVNNFVFRRGDATILIDAGAGNTMQPTLGRLPGELRAIGVDPMDVTHILLTHIHPDHANGLVNDQNEPVYTNAEIIVHRVEFDFWMRDDDGSDTDAVKRTRARNKINMRPYLRRVKLMQDGQDFMGCSPILAPGHSPGHTCWRIETGAEALMSWGDLVHFAAIQIPHPDVAVKYDLNADLARQSRLKMLDIVASQRFAIAGAHVDAPGVGHVSKNEAGYVFDPA